MGDEGLGWRDGGDSSAVGSTENLGRMLVGAYDFSFYTNDDLSIFPPRNHEGIYHSDLHQQQQIPYSQEGNCNGKLDRLESTSSACSSTVSCNFWNFRGGEESNGSFVRRVVESGMDLFYSKILPLWREWIGKTGGNGGGKRGREGLWTALVVMTLALLYTRYTRKRDKLRMLLLLREKDQKIGELLHRMAQLNEIFSQHKRFTELYRTTEASRGGIFQPLKGCEASDSIWCFGVIVPE